MKKEKDPEAQTPAPHTGNKTDSLPDTPDTFEVSMTRIEEIVGLLEEGKTGLDKSMELYEEGIRLIRACTSALDVAERKIRILQRGKDGTLVCKDFHPEEEKEDGNHETE